MKLNQEGVEKAARAAFDTYEAGFPLTAEGWDDQSQDTQDSWQAEIAAALTAYFDHLKQEGLMYEAQYNARYHVTNEGTFIIRTDKE